ncbi:hypothetical protein [Vibrio cholerae]|uniref:Uncharacterized protein n=1 Tax=Vibrio cholerae TaxID=666 RepID=A0A7Z7VLN3_VIBCL|nr:hypothetical protein [Vibrio cholerae]PNV69099.1 hypothetical protein C1Y48_20180 [Vibrio cholerae]TBM41348.1 hypothetical protein EYB64_12295 [Vibrio cholerae]
MRRFDTGYQYEPLLIRHDLSSDKGVYLDDSQLSNAKSEYSLICIGSASRYPLWQHEPSGEFIGGFYENIVSEDKLIAFYQAFKKETQIIGYEESKNAKWGLSKNPFPSSLSDSLPRHVWAKSYEKGSRVHREERHVDDLKTRNVIKGYQRGLEQHERIDNALYALACDDEANAHYKQKPCRWFRAKLAIIAFFK